MDSTARPHLVSQPDGSTATFPSGRDAVMLSSNAFIIRLDHGLYSLTIPPLGAGQGAPSGFALPCVQLSAPPSRDLDPVDILTAWNDQGAWLGSEGGTVVVRAPLGGGVVLATLYGMDAVARLSANDVEIRRLDQPRPAVARVDVVPQAGASPRAGAVPRMDVVAPVAPAAATVAMTPPVPAEPVAPPPSPVRLPKTDPAEVDIEIALHVQRLGDCTFSGGVWCGNIGQKAQIEALSIMPLERILPGDLEYKALGPGGRETRWVTDGKLCGTRGRGIPLTGFAIRLAPHVADRFDVIYQGAYFASGVTLPARNGEPCMPALADDLLEAVNIRVIERVAE